MRKTLLEEENPGRKGVREVKEVERRREQEDGRRSEKTKARNCADGNKRTSRGNADEYSSHWSHVVMDTCKVTG